MATGEASGPLTRVAGQRGGRIHRRSGSVRVMAYSCGNEDIDRFALVVLRTSWMVCDLVENLVEALPQDAFPSESQGSVVVEMLFGSMAAALESVDSTEVVRAADLIELTTDRVIEHLRLAYELSDRMHGGDGRGRGYG